MTQRSPYRAPGRDNRIIWANLENVMKMQRRELIGVLTVAAGSALL
jgi:hypothetical protein